MSAKAAPFLIWSLASTVFLKVWSLDPQQQHHSGICSKCMFLGPKKLWDGAQHSVLTSPQR